MKRFNITVNGKPFDVTCEEVAVGAQRVQPIQLHTHYTSGLASMAIIKSVEAGCDMVDTAISPLAMGTSHTATESVVAAFKGTPYDTGLDMAKLNVARTYFAKLRGKYLQNSLLNPKVMGVDANTLLYQVPGGMLSNLVSQLKQAGKEDKFDDVLREVPNVRKDAGYPPLVTPSSQIVGTQAVFNVITGELFEKYNEQEEDVLTLAQFPKIAPKFFEERKNKKYGVDMNYSDAQNKIHQI